MIEKKVNELGFTKWSDILRALSQICGIMVWNSEKEIDFSFTFDSRFFTAKMNIIEVSEADFDVFNAQKGVLKNVESKN